MSFEIAGSKKQSYMNIKNLLKKCEAYDPDIKIMAIRDLIAELNSFDDKLEESLQSHVRDTVLQQLDADSTDLQTVSASCISTLVKRINFEQTLQIFDKLISLLYKGSVQSDEMHKMVYVMTLKNIINSVSIEMGGKFASDLIEKLLRGMKISDQERILSIEVLLDVIRAFSVYINDKTLNKILHTIMPLLQSEHEGLQQQSLLCLSELVPFLNENTLANLMETVLKKIQEPIDNEQTYTYIRIVSVLVKSSGIRIGKYLPQVFPHLFNLLKQTTTNPPMKSTILRAFESSLVNSSSIKSFNLPILNFSLDLMSYDPNYCEDQDLSSSGHVVEGWEDDGEYVCTDDQVTEMDTDIDLDAINLRKASIACISAFFKSPNLLEIIIQDKKILPHIVNALMLRFTERNTNLLADVIQCLSEIIATNMNLPQIISLSYDYYGDIVNAALDIIPISKSQIKILLFILIQKITNVRSISNHFSRLFAIIFQEIKDSPKIDQCSQIFVLIKYILEQHSSDELMEYIHKIVYNLSPLFSSPEFVIHTFALIGPISLHIRKKPFNSDQILISSDEYQIFSLLYEKCSQIFFSPSLSYPIRKASILGFGTLISYFGDKIPVDESDRIMETLVSLLDSDNKSEGLDTLLCVANSEFKLDFSKIFPLLSQELLSFLKKDNVLLKYKAIELLDSMLSSNKTEVNLSHLSEIINKTSKYISDSDLKLSQHIFQLNITIIKDNPHPDTIQQIIKDVYLRLLKFVQSPSIMGDALSSLKLLFKKISLSNQLNITHKMIFMSLFNCVQSDISQNALFAISSCISSLSYDDTTTKNIVHWFLQVLSSDSSKQHKQLVFLSLSEIFVKCNANNLLPLEKISNFIISPNYSPEVKHSAALCAGSYLLSTDNNEINGFIQLLSENNLFFLLIALKEFIKLHHSSIENLLNLRSYMELLVPIFIQHGSSTDQDIAIISSECMGLLLLSNPAYIFNIFSKLNGISETCFVLSSIRVAIKCKLNQNVLFKELSPIIHKFLNYNNNIYIDNHIIMTIDVLLHRNIQYLTPFLSQKSFIQNIYENTKERKEYIRIVEFGEKFTVDDGLPLRKSAYKCCLSLLETASEYLDIEEFIYLIEKGLKDPSDEVMLLTYEIYILLSKNHPLKLLQNLDKLTSSFKSGIIREFRESKEQNADHEKTQRVLREAAKCLFTIKNLKNSNCPEFNKFYLQIEMTPALKCIIDREKSRWLDIIY